MRGAGLIAPRLTVAIKAGAEGKRSQNPLPERGVGDEIDAMSLQPRHVHRR